MVSERPTDGGSDTLAQSFSKARSVQSSRRRVVQVAGVAFLLLALALPALAQGQPPCTPGEQVAVPDGGLRGAIEDTLRLPFDHGDERALSCEDMLGLTRLYVQSPDYTVASLEGLQYAANLTWLKFATFPTPHETAKDYHAFSDLTPLAPLAKLQHLSIFTGGKIIDLTPLSNLKELQYLFVDELYPTVVDATPLEGMARLRWYGSAVVRYSSLEPFTHLQDFDLVGFNLADIRDVSAFRVWAQPPKVLYLSGNRIADVTPLAENPAFTRGYEINLERNCLGALPGKGWSAVEALRARGVKVVAPRNKEFPNSPECRQTR